MSAIIHHSICATKTARIKKKMILKLHLQKCPTRTIFDVKNYRLKDDIVNISF